MKVSSVQSVYGHRVYSPNIEGAAQKKSGVSPAGIMLGSLVSAIAIYKIAKPSPRVCSEYVKSLAAGVSEITGKNINPLTLSNVMNKEKSIIHILQKILKISVFKLIFICIPIILTEKLP